MSNNKLTFNFSMKEIFHANLFAYHNALFENAQLCNPKPDI